MKKFYYKIAKICGLMLIALSIGSSFIFIANHNSIDHNYETTIRYGQYVKSSNRIYTFNLIEWKFNSNNQSKITALKMDYKNHLKFTINDSSAEYEIISEGKTKDSGIIIPPYDDWVIILFFNSDISRSSTHIEYEVDILLNPVLYIFIPLILGSLILTSFVIISISYKKREKKNRITNYFYIFIISVAIYLFPTLFIFPFILIGLNPTPHP